MPELETSCISVLPEPPADFKIKGTALFLDGPMIVSMGEKVLRIPRGPADPSVSPHNKFLAYHEGGDLLVALSNGTVIRRVESNIVGAWVGGNWISDEYIRHFELIDGEYRPHVINIRTGESLRLHMDFPGMENGTGWKAENVALYLYGGGKLAYVLYDPSLSRVVYPKKGSFISLYNVPEDREQAAINMEGSDPIWSPDGQYFTFKGYKQNKPVEIYIISRDGDQFMPLTYLSQHYSQLLFGSYSWSPDSRKIAFWVRKIHKYGEFETLFVFDLTTMRIRDTCIKGIGGIGSIFETGLTPLAGPGLSGSPLGKDFILAGKPIWSPDSNKIILAQFDEENQQVIDLLVDLERGIAYPIATGLEPMGWMAGEP